MVALGAVCPASAAPQTASPSFADSGRLCKLVKQGGLVRVSTGFAGSTVGPAIRCDAQGIILGSYLGQAAPAYIVPAAEVQRVWVRRGSGLAGLVFGATLGGLSGGVIAGVRSGLCPVPPSTPYSAINAPCHGNVGAGAVAGAAVGGLIGWVIGHGLPHWKRVFP
jgi:hypothetical protein